MKIKIIFIFLLAIFIPTSLLAYFGLLAVRSEKSIIEKNIRESYEAIADIIISEINSALKNSSQEQNALEGPQAIEALILDRAFLFKGQVAVYDAQGKIIGGQDWNNEIKFKKPMLTRPIARLPYNLVVYEQYSFVTDRLEEKKEGLVVYVGIIIFSAFLILLGAFYTLRVLSKEWNLTKLKSDFVSQLSHDLRRPLTSIRMFSEMLNDHRVTNEEKKQEYYRIISNESERLTQLANNILDFSRIEAGLKKYDFAYQDIVGLVKESVERFQMYMMDEPFEIHLNLPRSSIALNLDRDVIAQAILNLLSNAAKYSPENKEIQVNLIKKEKEAVIEVIDKGMGIPLEEQKKIFNKFYRFAKKRAPVVEGSGLGLNLVKCAVLAHKGQVRVESQEGRGSKFSIILPLS